MSVYVLIFCFSNKIKSCNAVQVRFQDGDSFVDLFCYLFFMPVMLSCLFLAAMWSPAWKGLTFWLSRMLVVPVFVVSTYQCFKV